MTTQAWIVAASSCVIASRLRPGLPWLPRTILDLAFYGSMVAAALSAAKVLP